MASPPPMFSWPLLACIAWSCSLAGCGRAAIDDGRASSQQAGPDNPRPQSAASATEPASAIAVVPEKKTASVKIDQFAFEPAHLTIAPGTTVVWTNRDDVPHTVVEAKVGFRSQALDTDDVYRHTFDKAGTYRYFCSVHPHMVGDILVTQ